MGNIIKVAVEWLRGDDATDWFAVRVGGKTIPGEWHLTCAIHECHRPEPPDGVAVVPNGATVISEEVAAEAHRLMAECLGTLRDWSGVCDFCGKEARARAVAAAYREAAAIIEAVNPRDGNALNIRTVLALMEAGG